MHFEYDLQKPSLIRQEPWSIGFQISYSQSLYTEIKFVHLVAQNTGSDF